MVTGHAHLQNSALHADRPHPPVISNKGVLHFWPFAKYAVAFPRMSRSIFTRANSARNRLISICSTPYRLAAGRTLQPSFPLRLDPVVQGLLNHSQTSCRCCYALARLYHSNRFLLELERVLRSCRLCHLRLLALLNHSARDTFCAGKVSRGLSPLIYCRVSVLCSVCGRVFKQSPSVSCGKDGPFGSCGHCCGSDCSYIREIRLAGTEDDATATGRPTHRASRIVACRD